MPPRWTHTTTNTTRTSHRRKRLGDGRARWAQPNTGRAKLADEASKSCYKELHTMKIRVFLLTAALAAFGWVRLPATTSLMPIEEIKPGMIGTGRTIFEGAELK